MFDSDHTTKSGTTAGAFDDSVERLLVLYDGLLAHDDAQLSADEAAELKAMAGIFDLNAEGPATTVWRELRAVLVRQVPPSTADEFDTAAPREPLTLMLVEDDMMMAQDLMDVLVEAGHRVIGPFHNAEAAEVSAALHPIDLALLDLNLSGGGTGAELARSLRDKWGVPSLFLSGDVSGTARHAELAQAIVLKPYKSRDVLDAIARVRTASI